MAYCFMIHLKSMSTYQLLPDVC